MRGSEGRGEGAKKGGKGVEMAWGLGGGERCKEMGWGRNLVQGVCNTFIQQRFSRVNFG